MDENSPEQKFNKMMEEKQNQLNRQLNQTQGGPNTPGKGPSMEEQQILSQVQSSAPPAPVAPSQGECPQCKLFHPPIQPGEKCPNAPLEIDGAPEININEIVVKVKDILASQLEHKGVKEVDKFVGGMIVVLMKYCEDYKE